MCRSGSAAVIVLFVISFSANAAIVSGYGVSASASTSPDCPLGCNGGSNELVTDGGEFATAATAEVNNATATGFGSGSFGGSAFTPLLRASATSPLGASTQGFALTTAVQGYTFTGATTTSFSLFVELHGTTNEPDFSSDARIRSDLAVYILPDAPFVTHFGTLIFEYVALTPGAELLANESLFLSAGLGTDLASTTLNFSLDPGDEIYVFANLSARASRGGSADATNTLSMTFNDASLLQATVVPVPAAVWLFGSALIGLLGIRRRT